MLSRLKTALQSPTSNLFWQLVRYCISGGIASLIDICLLYVLTRWGGMHYLLGALIGYSAGIVCTYIFSIKWVFDHRSMRDQRKEFIVFVMIGIAGLLLTQLLMWFFTEIVFMNEQYSIYSKLITIAIVSLANFLLKKLFLFTKQPNKNEL